MKMEWRRLFFRIDLWLLAVLLLIVNIALFSMQEKELWQETAGEYGVGVEAVQEEYRTQLEAYRGMDLQEAWADCSEKIRQSSMAVEWNMSDSVRSIWIAPLLEHLSGYEAYLQQIRNNAEMFGQISIFSEEDSFAVRNIKKTSQDFDRLSDVKIKTGEYSAVAEIASSHAADWLILVAGIAFLFLMMEERTLAGAGSWNSVHESLPALYEKMLKTALEEPEKIGELGYLLQMITKEDIVPDEFRDLYATFKKTLRLK